MMAHEENYDPPEIAGSCFGVDITPREKHAPLITLCVEDDEHWHRKECFDAGWIDDLINVLQKAKKRIKELEHTS